MTKLHGGWTVGLVTWSRYDGSNFYFPRINVEHRMVPPISNYKIVTIG